MNTQGVILMLGLEVALLAATMMGVRLLVRQMLGPMAKAFPFQSPSPEGVSRGRQSFSIGFTNFTGCVRATADAEHLHLEPHSLARWFGMPSMSIPWHAIAMKPGSAGRRMMTATVSSGKQRWTLKGPRWCLELANPPVPAGQSTSTAFDTESTS